MISKGKKRRIFLDYASSTPVAKEVAKVMGDFQIKNFANPSALYSEALFAKEKMTEARGKIASILSCQKNEIIFTSSGTESNNLALLGVFENAKEKGIKKPHFVTTSIEHPAILEVCNEIERRGGEITIVSVSPLGIVSPKDIFGAIKENTVLVSVMYANNEIGTIQPIKEISKLIKNWREKNNSVFPYFHTDACQAVLYCSVDVLRLGVDMMTVDGIKMYGPRGMGFLYVRNGVELTATHFGGGQENNLRSGTENVAGIIGLAKAFEIAEKIKEKETARLLRIRDYAIERILATFPDALLNGSQDERLPNNINICFLRLDAEFAVISLDVAGIAVSYSSACRTLSENSTSYVIEAIGKPDCASSSLRITMGRETTKKDIDDFIKVIKKL